MFRYVPTALVLALGLSGCIKSTSTADDPETDAQVGDAQLGDAQVGDAAPVLEPAPIPPPEPEPEQSCDAEPVCPRGYDQVQACEDGGVCETVTTCGDSILCQTCPPGAGFVCPEGMYEVDACTNDGSCFGITDCSGTIMCESCDVCPEGMIRVPDCLPDVPCFRCEGDGDGLFPACAPEDQVRCPPHTSQVDDCLEDDPLCWVLNDGTACLSTLCPVRSPCGGLEAEPVDACAPDSLGCFERTLCGDALTCEVVSHDCDDCEPSCPDGYSQVPQCVPDGRHCMRIAECCSELYCQANQ